MEVNKFGFFDPSNGMDALSVELCVWPSLWMFSRAKDSNYIPNIKKLNLILISDTQ